MAMVKVMVAMTPEMKNALDDEAKRRRLPSTPELIRRIIGDYLEDK